MIRARQTAEPTSILTGKKLEILEWTSENLTWKDFSVEVKSTNKNYRTWCFYAPGATAELRSENVTQLGAKWYQAEFFQKWKLDAESGYQRIRHASDDFLASCGYIHTDNGYRVENDTEERIAVFCHQGFGLSWLGVMLDIPLPIIWTTMDISHSCMTVIRFSNTGNQFCIPRMLMLSNDSHLYAEGLPTKYQNDLYF